MTMISCQLENINKERAKKKKKQPRRHSAVETYNPQNKKCLLEVLKKITLSLAKKE